MMPEKSGVGIQITSNNWTQLGKYIYFSTETDQETQSRMYSDFSRPIQGENLL